MFYFMSLLLSKAKMFYCSYPIYHLLCYMSMVGINYDMIYCMI